jgi:DUF296 family protein family protein
LSTVLVQVNRDQEVIETIAREAAKRGITAAGISLIGAVQRATISVMKKDEPKTDYLREYDQPFELTGTGEITTDGVHVHVTPGRRRSDRGRPPPRGDRPGLLRPGVRHAAGRLTRQPINRPWFRSAATGVAACSRRPPCHDYNGHCAGSREPLTVTEGQRSVRIPTADSPSFGSPLPLAEPVTAVRAEG